MTEPAEIGVIMPYKAQVRRIKTLLHGAGHGLEQVMVGSVEQFQGQVDLLSPYVISMISFSSARRNAESLYFPQSGIAGA